MVKKGAAPLPAPRGRLCSRPFCRGAMTGFCGGSEAQWGSETFTDSVLSSVRCQLCSLDCGNISGTVPLENILALSLKTKHVTTVLTRNHTLGHLSPRIGKVNSCKHLCSHSQTETRLNVLTRGDGYIGVGPLYTMGHLSYAR